MADISTLHITFTDRLSNLYDVGYLSVDFFQLIAFAEALEDGNEADVARWYGEKAKPFNRYARVLEKRAEKSQIVDVRRGSVILEIALPTLATCVCTLIVPFIQRHLDNAEVEFSIDADDIVVRRAIEAYAHGAFGRGPSAIERLSEHLAQNDRYVDPLGKNAYSIHRVLERYSKRIIRTLKRP